jgi:hypothetical protein
MIPTLALLVGSYQVALHVSAVLLTLGLAVEAFGHWAHAKAMGSVENEGGASYYIQSTTCGKTFILRNVLLGLNLLLASGLLASLLLLDNAGLLSLLGWALVGGVLVLTSLVSRALFYVLVIATTMPGAFFWKNKGFEQHACDIGLANMPQVGMAQLRH